MNHLDEVSCLRYLDGELDRVRRREVSGHLEGCPRCRSLLQTLERESRLLCDALLEADEPFPARGRTPAGEFSWTALTVFGFAAGGLYTFWSGLILPWWEQLRSVGMGQGTLVTTLFFRGVLWEGWATMGEKLLEMLTFTVLALGLALVGVGMVRWGRRWRNTTPVILSALLGLLLIPQGVWAAEIKPHKQHYTLAAGDTVRNDLIVRAQTARIEGTVEGDLILFGQEATVTGHVTGDVLAFCQTLRISGAVDGNVRVFSQFFGLSGPVGKNVTSFVQNFTLDPQGQVDGSLTFGAATAATDGRVRRDLMAFAGHHRLGGLVEGSAVLRGDRLSITPKAEIRGKAKFTGRHQPEVSSEAKLASPLEVRIEKRRPKLASARYYWGQALRWAVAFVFGLGLVWLLPGFFANTVRSLSRYGPSFGIGALSAVAIPLLAILVCITIVGLAVGLTTLLLYLVAVYSAQVFVGTWVGQKLLGEAGDRRAMIPRLALGLLALRILGLIPYLGNLLWLVLTFWALGALILATRRYVPQPAPPASAM